MSFDRNTIFGILSCFVFISGYSYYMKQKYPEQQIETATVVEGTKPAPLVVPSDASTSSGTKAEAEAAAPVTDGTDPAANALAPITLLSPEELVIETENRTFIFDQNHAAVKSIRLKKYAEDQLNNQPAELLDAIMALQGTTQLADKNLRSGFSAMREGNTITFSRKEGLWLISQKFTIPEQGYGIDVDVSFQNTSGAPQELTAATIIQENIKRPADVSMFTSMLTPASVNDISFVYGKDEERTEVQLKAYCGGKEGPAINLSNEKVSFLGLDKHYFLALLWAKDLAMNYSIERSAPASDQLCPIATTISQSYGQVEAGGRVDMKLMGYYGPKRVEDLEALDPVLTHSIKLGWFSIIAHPLLLALKAIYKWVGNWGVAIIIVTFILKMAFYPLTRMQTISMKRMQKVQPELNALREKYKSDPPKQQREMMAFMSKHKINPLRGCLPILPTLPFFVAFYNLLSQAIELRHAPFFGWITDLAARDPYFITPILLGVFMFANQKLTPNTSMDKNQEKIMLMVPVMISMMMLGLPAGLVLYMITNTVVSIIQQQWLNHRIKIA